ncbi:MAG: hypothetical protein JW931_01990 [Methanomicrobiaceae archaeon]|nr:hypothetical protein [Methanomicrobiaceae archaeon]
MDSNLFKKGIIGFLVLVLAAGLVLTAGCTGSPETAPADTGAGSQATAESTASSSAPVSSGEVVHYTTLMQYLPTAPSTGWINGDATGMQASEGGYSWSWASKNYEQKMGGDAIVDIIIQDTNEAMVGQMAAWDSYVEIETPVMSMKKVTVEGNPGWVVTDTESDTISQIVNIGDRFIVYTVIEGGKEDYLTVFNGLTDFKGIAGLA